MQITFNELPTAVAQIQCAVEKLTEIVTSSLEKLSKHPTSSEDKPMSMTEACEYIGCSMSTLLRLKKDGLIPYHQYGKVVYFLKNEIDQSSLVDLQKFQKSR